VRIQDGENYSEWLERVRLAELDLAKKALHNGSDINLVLEAMSERIVKKMLHPILTELRNVQTPFDIQKHRSDYESAMRNRKPVADHVEDDKDIDRLPEDNV
jgi:glutamyl-tRNA reductase